MTGQADDVGAAAFTPFTGAGASTSMRWILVPALAAQALVTALVCLRIGPLGWDDGAITLAFSHTFALIGRPALTPQSETVEGFSSLAWFLLNSLAARSGVGFSGSIAIAQALAGAAFMVSTILLGLIGRRLNLRPGTLAVAVWIFALSGPGLAEIAAGMEMGLLCASGLALVHALYIRRNWPLAILSAVVFLTTRFEAALYFAVLLGPLLLGGQFRTFLLMSGVGLAVFGVEEAWRWSVFADWAPNTIHAKLWPPYSGGDAKAVIASRAQALAEPAAAALPLLSIIALLALVRRGAGAGSSLVRRARPLWVVLAPILAVELFGLVAGRNLYGALGRMQLLALPFVLIAAGLGFDALSTELSGPRRRLLLILAAALSIETGAFLSARPALEALRMPRPLGDDLGVSAANYRITGLAVDALRQRLGLGRMVFMTPDIGGASLCCERLRMVDLGLLANRRLARTGYGAVAEVLAAERPDVVEAHEVWARASGVLTLPSFEAGYTPLMAGRTRLYLRNDRARALIDKGQAAWCPLVAAACRRKALLDHRNLVRPPYGPEDDLAFLRLGRFLVLTDAP
ncbi:MAG: hypothetical protein ACXWK7_00395 [Caulobacteraceae bacterium]